MLADGGGIGTEASGLRADLHEVGAFRFRLLDFIRDELPKWRDHPDRKAESAENKLTHQLCNYLCSASRHSTKWNSLQFRTEVPDEKAANRSIDLVPFPSDAVIWIDGIRHSIYDPILPIECKRLPTPKGADRDEREYLFSKFKTTGGVQRFKAGHHGAAYTVGAIIGYVQSGNPVDWFATINGWASELAAHGVEGWSKTDTLSFDNHDPTGRLASLDSRHRRISNLEDIDLKHLWIEM